MAKSSGLGARFLVDGYNISADVVSLTGFSSPTRLLDFTDITESAFERKASQRDGQLAVRTFWNPARAHLALRGLTTSDRIATYAHRATIGSSAVCVNGKQLNYDHTRGEDGSFQSETQVVANGYGAEWGKLLTAVTRTDTGATTGASVDFTAGASFGLQAYLHVVAFTGTDATITIQGSSDNAVGDPFSAITGGAFAAVTSAPGAQRIETGRAVAVERYLRVVTTTTGGFSSLEFVVVANINDVSVVF